MKKIFAFSFVIFVLAVIFIFRNWLGGELLTGGDWTYYSSTMVKNTTLLTSWDDRYSGVGNNKVIKLPLEVYFVGTMKLAQGIDWKMYERIFWFFPFLVLSLTSAYLLTKKIVGNSSFALIGSFLYTTNTYALMLIGGGQNGVALAYSCLPFLVLTYLNLLENSDSFFLSLLFTYSLSILILFDFRIVYVSLPILAIITFFYFLYYFPGNKLIKRFFYTVGVPALFTLGLHAFWILPLLFSRGSAMSQFGEVYTGVGAVKFFSFAFFENALGLLHPNWPENIFGKVNFMRPEFLVYPLLAFGSLLFLKPYDSLRLLREKKERIYILCFVLVGLMGVFLAKGANDPFGGLYLWMFDHVPGFIMFRDPTKWYMLVAVSYIVLIPYSLNRIYEIIKVRVSK